MKILVTGSAGHLGEALVRRLKEAGHALVGIDINPSLQTQHVGSIVDREFVHQCMSDVEAVLHTATLHKPHVGTHSRQEFIDTNITGTLNLLEEAVSIGCRSFIYTSTTSTFGDAMKAVPGGPAIWVTEDLRPKPKNIYGVTKTAAEDLRHLFSRNTGLPCLVLKTSRFFLQADDNKEIRDAFSDDNVKVNELLYRRVDVEDIVTAHQLALVKAEDIGFDRFIITATTPFKPSDAEALGTDAAAVLERYVPDYVTEYSRRDWRMFPTIGRVYDNTRAREVLGWSPRYNFADVVGRLTAGNDYRSDLALQIGIKGYHKKEFEDGLYPVRSF